MGNNGRSQRDFQIERVTDALGGETSYTYHPFGELHEVTVDATTASLVYYTLDRQDALGRVTEATLGSGLSEQRTFSKATGRLVSIQTGPNPTVTLQNFAYDSDFHFRSVLTSGGRSRRTNVIALAAATSSSRDRR